MRENLRSVFCLAVLTFCAVPLGFAQNLEVKTPSDLSSRNRDAIEATRDQCAAIARLWWRKQ
jgi:hypothetical protein